MKIGIIGGGVIGVTTALTLLKDGHAVTLFDRDGICAGASQGNAGAFALTDVTPMAAPGLAAKAPRWLLDPLGPLSIRPAYAPRIAPWLWRFWRASRPESYRRGIRAQDALMRESRRAAEQLIADFHLEDRLRREGQLQLYQGAASFRASLKSWDINRAHGIPFDLLEHPEAIAEIQPGLAPGFTHAAFTPGWFNVTDPKLWVEHLAGLARGLGLEVRRTGVRAVLPDEHGARIIATDGDHDVDKAVIATGAWSKALTRPLGLDLPLDTERGYNTTLPAQALDLRTFLTFEDHGFVVARNGEGIRVGGAVEFAGLNLPPNMARADAMLTRAKTFLPALDTAGGTQWMGFRPSMPDSQPVIGPVPDHPDILMGFGHGHLGLTQSAGTAQLLADLIAARPPRIDPAPYAATRF